MEVINKIKINGKEYQIGGTGGGGSTVTVSDIAGGHRLTITDENGTQTVDVLDGSTKLDKVTTAGSAIRVYCVDLAGNQIMQNASASALASAIAIRLSGGRLAVGSPSSASDAVPLSYLTTAMETVLAQAKQYTNEAIAALESGGSSRKVYLLENVTMDEMTVNGENIYNVMDASLYGKQLYATIDGVECDPFTIDDEWGSATITKNGEATSLRYGYDIEATGQNGFYWTGANSAVVSVYYYETSSSAEPEVTITFCDSYDESAGYGNDALLKVFCEEGSYPDDGQVTATLYRNNTEVGTVTLTVDESTRDCIYDLEGLNGESICASGNTYHVVCTYTIDGVSYTETTRSVLYP